MRVMEIAGFDVAEVKQLTEAMGYENSRDPKFFFTKIVSIVAKLGKYRAKRML